jgi:hypothetical protein
LFKPFRSESENLWHSIGRKAGIILRYVLAAHSLGQAGEDVRNRETGSLDCRLPSEKLGIGDNPTIARNRFDWFVHGVTILQFETTAKGSASADQLLVGLEK